MQFASISQAPRQPAGSCVTPIIFNQEFIIVNQEFIILNTEFISINTEFIILNTEFIIYIPASRPPS